MYRLPGQLLLTGTLLLLCCWDVRARPNGSLTREIRRVKSIKDILLGEALSEETPDVPKKRLKNHSGKSNEEGYYETFGSDADGEKGYSKKTHSKGDHGYKTLDTFHKQGGDKYGFEEHTAYGQAKADKTSNKGSAKNFKSKIDKGDHESAGTEFFEHADGDNEGDFDSGYYGGHYAESGGEGEGEGGGGGYEYSGGDGESYAEGDHDEGSYESHSSYSTGDEDQADNYS
ncbi:serine-aspartate repeat-containing protein C-like [Prorops nasuta]|uniref:serine-aspartate repeat-containing protein C-like n=1 Tax=Prorops nasuta TaxID=863751 RepID=UPI0034CFF188